MKKSFIYVQNQLSITSKSNLINTKKRDNKIMPYIIVEAWFPTDIVQEVADKYMEMLKEFPFDRSLGKETRHVAASSNSKGIKIMSVMEAKQDKLYEAIRWIGNRMMLFQSIKGYEYKTRLWSTVVEALEPLGMSMPG